MFHKWDPPPGGAIPSNSTRHLPCHSHSCTSKCLAHSWAKWHSWHMLIALTCVCLCVCDCVDIGKFICSVITYSYIHQFSDGLNWTHCCWQYETAVRVLDGMYELNTFGEIVIRHRGDLPTSLAVFRYWKILPVLNFHLLLLPYSPSGDTWLFRCIFINLLLVWKHMCKAEPGHYPAKYPVPVFFRIPFPPFVEYGNFESRSWILFFIQHVIESRLTILYDKFFFLKMMFFSSITWWYIIPKWFLYSKFCTNCWSVISIS